MRARGVLPRTNSIPKDQISGNNFATTTTNVQQIVSTGASQQQPAPVLVKKQSQPQTQQLSAPSQNTLNPTLIKNKQVDLADS